MLTYWALVGCIVKVTTSVTKLIRVMALIGQTKADRRTSRPSRHYWPTSDEKLIGVAISAQEMANTIDVLGANLLLKLS